MYALDNNERQGDSFNGLKLSKPVGRQQCLRSSSFDSEASSGVLVRRNEENAWRKFGTRWRLEKVRADEEARGESFTINQHCAIERYYEISERVMEQFLESLQYADRLEESFLSGNRLLKFLSSSLPTHRRFFSKDPLLTKLRIKSRNDLAQLGIMVEEVALKIDKNIYEDYLWGKVPDCEVEPSLHPLIFDDDHCTKKSSKKVTFSLHKTSGNDDGTLFPTDTNISCSSSTSTTDVSECSLSSPELLHNQDATFSSSDQPWFSNVAESNVQRNNVAWKKGSMHHEDELFPPSTNDFMLRSADNTNMSSQIYWSGSIGTERKAHDLVKRVTKDEWGNREPNAIAGIKNSVIVNRPFHNHNLEGKVDRPVVPTSRNNLDILEGKRLVLKQCTSWESEDEERDHADYVKNLTHLEFNGHESPIRQNRLNNTLVPGRDATKSPSFTATRHEEDGMKVRKGVERDVQNQLQRNTHPNGGFSLHDKEEDSSASPTTIIHFNDRSCGRATSTSIHQSSKPGREPTDLYTDQLSESSFSEEEDIDLGDGTGLGIARRDEHSTDNVAFHVEHLQYLKDLLVQDDPEANECSWGKSWLKQLNGLTLDAPLDQPGHIISNHKPRRNVHRTESIVSNERNDRFHIQYTPKIYQNVLEGREHKVQSHRVNVCNDEFDLDASGDEPF